MSLNPLNRTLSPMNTTSDQEQHSAFPPLRQRSVIEAELRGRLARSMHSTLKNEIGIDPDQPVRFVEPGVPQETEAREVHRHTIILPKAENDALFEDQLEVVSGGTTGERIEHVFGDVV